MLFKEVIGQETVKQHLLKTVQCNRLSHALLFIGPEGCGKLPIALALAQYLNCTNKNDNDSCGDCPSCKKYAKLIHSDLHFVFPVLKTTSIKNPVSDSFIKEWREKILKNPYFNLNQWFESIDSDKGQGMIYSQESHEIIKKLNMKAFEGEYKIMIIWHPEKMHDSAANKLLKMIEEPPSRTIFIMITDTLDGILGTILSRTQQLKFSQLNDSEIIEALTTKQYIDKQTAEYAAKLATGNFIKAIDIANESEENEFYFEKFISLMRLSYGRKLMDLFDWIDSLTDQPKERIKNFIIYCLRMVRENYIMNLKQPSIVYMTPNEENFSNRFSPFINDRNAFQIAEELSLVHAHLEQNGNVKIILTDFILKLIILLKE
ncbi:MAG: DNA polymerase III subunit delta' [Marinilabiliaceae bacterium]|nr:DNA polymerase III subunit delta' [Marinilabiliaceae bacterium]